MYMMETFELTNYNFYSSRVDMELITTIVDSLKEILEEDKKQEQPLFLKVADNFIMNIARKVVQEKKKTFLIGITGESASGKTVFVDNTIEAVVREKKDSSMAVGLELLDKGAQSVYSLRFGLGNFQFEINVHRKIFLCALCLAFERGVVLVQRIFKLGSLNFLAADFH